jgi:ubiquitin-protein ligase E3 C
MALLNSMAFARPLQPLTRRLWTLLTATTAPLDVALLAEIVTTDGASPSPAAATPLFVTVSTSAHGPLLLCAADQLNLPPAAVREGVLSCLYVLCCAMAHQMAATDDEEFFEGKIIPLGDIKALVKLLKMWLYKLYWTHPLFDGYSDFKDDQAMPSLVDLQTQIAVTRLFNLLFTRNERRPFLADDAWLFKGIARLDAEAVKDVLMSGEHDQAVRTGGRTNTLHQLRTLLSCIPQVIPFDQRVDVFQALLRTDKDMYYTSVGGNPALSMAGTVRFKVRRPTIVEDAFVSLNAAGSRLKGRLQVEFVGEAGIDGGGLFKEFIDSFLKAAFDPALGLFSNTSGQLLVPNPASSHSAYPLCFAVSEMDGTLCYSVDGEGPNPSHTHLSFFHFLGKMLGKALYEVRLCDWGRLYDCDVLYAILCYPVIYYTVLR